MFLQKLKDGFIRYKTILTVAAFFIAIFGGIALGYKVIPQPELSTQEQEKQILTLIDKKTADRLSKYKRENRPIIAVGTTVVRTLESAVNTSFVILNKVKNLKPNALDPWVKPQDDKFLEHLSGITNLFIREPYTFKFIDGMITNFHVPKSSLLMLVAAFIGRRKLLNLYHQAIQNNYHFYSFGDGMLLL